MTTLALPVSPLDVEDAITLRNDAWADCSLIPSWVDHDEVDIDRFYTHSEVARECWDSLYAYMKDDHADTEQYQFVDPGAGAGAFYDLMPEGRRIGIDIFPLQAEFIQQDYLTWTPPRIQSRYAVLGNPPFGYRAWLALAFLNHSATFADYIGFIVPMGFQSDGKGSPKHRVRGAQLVHSERLSDNAFVDGNGQPVKINALWQIWRRGVNNVAPAQTCTDWVDIFTVDTRAERLCGQRRMHEATWFLQRTFYGDPPTLVTDFDDVKYACGYGIVIKRDVEAITEVLSADGLATILESRTSQLSAHFHVPHSASHH